jgi:hypothetical protein
MAMQVPHPTVQGAAAAHGAVTSAGENPWINYFGPPNGPITTRAYDKYAEQTYDLPEAYVGKNLFLRDTIDGLITESERPAFYTSVLLPWAQTDQINFSWNEFHFNETLAGRVPHEGVSRLVTSSRRTRQDKSVRRGLAMLLEHGFMSTPEGQEQYRRNLQGIAQCVQETANHDVMGSLLSCDNYDRRWERDHGVRTTGVRAMMQNEVQNFAIVQKTPHGLDILVEDIKKRLGRYGVTPDAMVVPPKFAIYLTLVRPERTTYSLAGPDGSQNIRQGPDAMTNFRGLNVFESRSFDVYANEPPVDLALRNRQVGEYYIPKLSDFQDGEEKSSKGAGDILVYNEDTDNWHKIGFEAGLRNNKLIQEIGILAGENDPGKIARVAAALYPKAVTQQLLDHMQTLPGYRTAGISMTAADGEIKCTGAGAEAFLESNPCPDPLFSNVQPIDRSEEYPDGGFKITICRKFDDIHPAHCLKAATQPAAPVLSSEISTAFVDLFGPTHARETLRQVLAAGGSGRNAPEAAKIATISDSGYTGFTTLHCSYRGLGLIEKEGTVEEAEKALLIKRFVHKTAQDTLHLHSRADNGAASILPPNYLCNSTGLQRVATAKLHCVHSALFNELFEVGLRHTLAPVNADGTPHVLAHTLPGDAILCPDFYLAKFAESHNGIVGKLAVTNCGIGVVEAKAKRLPDAVSGEIFTSGLRSDNIHGAVANMWKVASNHLRSSDAAATDRGAPRRRFDLGGDAPRAPQSANADLAGMFGAGINAQPPAAASATAAAADFAIVEPGGVLGANFFTGKYEAIKPAASEIIANDADITVDNCIKAYRAGSLPFRLMYARPFIEHQMYTLIVMKGGPETGSCFYGHNSVTVGDDAVSKMHYCNATFYMKAVVRAEKNVYKAEDVYAAGYVGGNGCEFFQNREQVQNFDASHPDAPSIFSFVVSRNEAGRTNGPVNLTGRFRGNLADDHVPAARLQFGTGPVYSQLFGLHDVAAHDPNMQGGIPGFVSITRQTNTTCFQGAQVDYNAVTGKFDQETTNTGHWGATYPGVRAVRDGAQRYVQPPVPTRSPYPADTMVAAVGM